MPEHWREFITRKHEKYKLLSPTPCPAFNGEPVYFNKHGFNHLIRKGKIPRTLSEVRKRLNMLADLPKIISSSSQTSSYTITKKHSSTAHWWSFIYIKNGKKVIVIVRQIDNGKKHFFSVFGEDILGNGTRVPKDPR